MMTELFRKAGTVFANPDKPEQGYRLTRDVFRGEFIEVQALEPIGDAPTPVAGEFIPEWLVKQVLHG